MTSSSPDPDINKVIFMSLLFTAPLHKLSNQESQIPDDVLTLQNSDTVIMQDTDLGKATKKNPQICCTGGFHEQNGLHNSPLEEV